MSYPHLSKEKSKYTLSLIEALNWYNITWNTDDYRSNIVDAMDSVIGWEKYKSAVKSAPYYDIRSLSALIHMLLRNEPLSEKDRKSIDYRLETVYKNWIDENKNSLKTEEIKENKIHTEYVSLDCQSRIEDFIDEIIDGKSFTQENVSEIFSISEKYGTKKNDLVYIKAKIKEFSDIRDKKDIEIFKSYNKPVKIFKEIVSFLESVESILEKSSKIKVTTRKKKLSPEKLAKNMKVARNIEEFKIVGIPAKDIVGSSSIFVYNTKQRRIIRYVSQKGMTLSVSGVSVTNFDPEKSEYKTIRHPKEFFESFNGKILKSDLKKKFDEISGGSNSVPLRLNNQFIILSV